jgi:hypothetical protein
MPTSESYGGVYTFIRPVEGRRFDVERLGDFGKYYRRVASVRQLW